MNRSSTKSCLLGCIRKRCRRSTPGRACGSGLVSCAVLGVFAVLCVGAPFLPVQRNVPDAMVSLASLTSVQLRVLPVSRDLVERGVTERLIRTRLETALARMQIGIEVSPDAPTLEITATSVAEPAIPDALAFNVRLLLYQSAHVDRVGRKLVVPTFADFNVSLDRSGKIKETALLALDEMLERFKFVVKSATRQVEQETKSDDDR